MKLLPLAVALALSLSTTMAHAQAANTANMSAGLTMLEKEVGNAFRQYRIDANPMDLTLSQLVEIVNLLNDGDRMSGGNGKSAIEAAIRRQ